MTKVSMICLIKVQIFVITQQNQLSRFHRLMEHFMNKEILLILQFKVQSKARGLILKLLPLNCLNSNLSLISGRQFFMIRNRFNQKDFCHKREVNFSYQFIIPPYQYHQHTLSHMKETSFVFQLRKYHHGSSFRIQMNTL